MSEEEFFDKWHIVFQQEFLYDIMINLDNFERCELLAKTHDIGYFDAWNTLLTKRIANSTIERYRTLLKMKTA